MRLKSSLRRVSGIRGSDNMFIVIYKHDYVYETRTVLAVDRPTESFLTITPWDAFEWIPMDQCLFERACP